MSNSSLPSVVEGCETITLTAVFLPLPFYLTFSLYFLVISFCFSSAHTFLLVVDMSFLTIHPFHFSFWRSWILFNLHPTAAHLSSLLFWTHVSLSLIFLFYTNFLPSLSLDLFLPVYPVWSLSVTSVYITLCVCVGVHVSHTMVPSPVYQAAWTVHSWGSSTVHPIAAHPLLALRPIRGGSQAHLVGTGQILLRATASA